MRISDWSSDVCSSDLSRGEESDQQLVEAMAEALSKTGIGIDRFFFDWFGGHRHGPGPEDAGYDRPEFTDFIARLSSYAPRLGSTPDYFRDAAPCSMLIRSEEHTSELQSLMRISYAVFCLKKKTTPTQHHH